MVWKRQEIKKRLERLFPGESSERTYHRYRLRQKRAALLTVLLGIVAGICSYANSHIQSKMQEGSYLPRNEWGEGSYEVTLSATVGETEEDITYVVEERQYSDKELSLLWEQAIETLRKEIAGQNESLLCVRTKLNLPTQLAEYPFTITWKSSDYGKLHTDGTVHTQEVSADGEEVILTATLSYHESSREQEFLVKIYPELLSSEQKRRKLLEQLISESDEASGQQERMVLPQRVGTEQIIWEERPQSKSGYFLLLGLLGAVMAVLGMDRDLQKKDKERERELAMCYPEFVSSLQLYLGAGLSLRNVFFKIGNDYKNQKGNGGRKQFLYEELLIACNRLSNGVSEAEVYREWANRCDEVHYRRLGYLLLSYRRQGNASIMQQLGKEVYNAWEERRNQVRKQGEEAGTKLLFPMILMLLVVMFLILLPVYAGF